MTIIITLMGLFALLSIRRIWVAYAVERYSFCATHYLTMTQGSQELCDEMSELWPIQYPNWELWNWGFRRYVVDHEHYDLMRAWMDGQLAREDLDYATLRREVAAITKDPAEQMPAEDAP